MRLLRFLLAAIFIPIIIQGQTETSKFKPQLKAGMILDYEVYTDGETVPLLLKIASIGGDGIIFNYEWQNSTVGKLINSKSNLENGMLLNWDAPVPGEERRLEDNQTIIILSRPFFKELKSESVAKYDGLDLYLTSVPKGSEIIVDGKEIQSIFVQTRNGASRYWILDNEEFPLLLKLEGNLLGVDLALKKIR
jgi:hypothetical protein